MRAFPPNDIISLVAQPPRYDLAESVGPDLQLGDLHEGVIDPALAALPLGYGTAQGDLRVRERLAQVHAVTADDVVLTIGGAHAHFLASFLLCESGNEAVVVVPSFPVVRNGLEAVGARVRTVRAVFDHAYALDVDALCESLSARTTLVSVASPQNPSGVSVPRAALRKVLDAMAQRCPRAYLVVDETYREATYGSAAVAESAVTLDRRVIVTGSLSKCHGAPGLRLGWAITRDAALREQLTVAKFNTVISLSVVDEVLALRVLERRDAILDTRRAHLASGVAATEAWAARNAALVEWVRPDAGALSCARLRNDVFDDAAVTKFSAALTRRNARVGSGTWFGEQPRVFRLGFGLLSTADLETALTLLEEALREAARVQVE